MNPVSKQKLKIPTWLWLALVPVFILLAIWVSSPAGQNLLGRLEKICGLSDFQDVAQDWPFSFHVISVGKADALLVLADEEAILIDGGTTGSGEDVADYLRRAGVQQLSAVINTHADEDHYGGLSAVLERFPCEQFCISAYSTGDDPAYLALLEKIQHKDIPLQTWKTGDAYSFGNFRVEVLSPSKLYKETNDQSLVLRLVYGERSFLLTGDAQEDAETDLLESGQTLSADILKVGHHGSRTSTTQAFLDQVSPSCAVFSTGEDRNHLPNSDVLQRLEEAGIPILRTDLDGTLIFCTDGHRLQAFAETTRSCVFEIQ